MKKTLLEHRYEPWIESLRNDPSADCCRCLLAEASLAKKHGWKHTPECKCIDIRVHSICFA
jgi:hypothetical protein